MGLRDRAEAKKLTFLKKTDARLKRRSEETQRTAGKGFGMYRFFVSDEQIGEKQIRIAGSDVNHIKNVLRMKKGDELLVSDGGGTEYTCYIEELGGEEILAHIMYSQASEQELASRIYLFQGLPKGDKMELIVQKAVELGVFEIVPVAAKRCVVKLDEKKAENKRKRWQAIAESAAKQSRRTAVPGIAQVMSFAQAAEYAAALDVRLIPYELARGMAQTRAVLEAIEPGQSIGVFIGPEGGFDEGEIALAETAGIRPITLGKRILRTETAGMAVLSVLMYLLER